MAKNGIIIVHLMAQRGERTWETTDGMAVEEHTTIRMAIVDMAGITSAGGVSHQFINNGGFGQSARPWWYL